MDKWLQFHHMTIQKMFSLSVFGLAYVNVFARDNNDNSDAGVHAGNCRYEWCLGEICEKW